MLIDFHSLSEITCPGMNNGQGTMSAKMVRDEAGKIILCRIHPGGSIGLHRHETSDDINYVLSGTGKALCDGVEEILSPGCCHVCKKGSEHSICNTEGEDLVLFTIVPEK